MRNIESLLDSLKVPPISPHFGETSLGGFSSPVPPSVWRAGPSSGLPLLAPSVPNWPATSQMARYIQGKLHPIPLRMMGELIALIEWIKFGTKWDN